MYAGNETDRTLPVSVTAVWDRGRYRVTGRESEKQNSLNIQTLDNSARVAVIIIAIENRERPGKNEIVLLVNVIRDVNR